MILVTTKNEPSEKVEKFVKELTEFIAPSDIVFVDDTGYEFRDWLRGFGVTVLQGQDRGIGSALRYGFQHFLLYNSDDYLTQMDCCGETHKVEDLKRLLQTPVGASAFAYRQFKWKGFRTLISWLAAKMFGVPDATCGFRTWYRDDLLYAMSKVPWADGHAFQAQMLSNLFTKETYVDWVAIEYNLDRSSFKLKMLKEAWEVYLERIKRNALARLRW